MSKPEATPGMNSSVPPGVRLSANEWSSIREILDRWVPDYRVWAFGSRVVGRPRRYSDLDLALEGEAPLSDERLDALREAFRESPLPWKVDILDLATVDPAFRRRIEASRVCLHEPMARGARSDGGSGQ